MSIKVMSAVWDSAVPAPERFTLLALADSMNDTDGWCWPSIATLAQKVRLHQATVRRHLANLVEQGLVEYHERPGRSTLYRIVVAALPTDEEPPADREGSQIARGRKSQGDPPTDCEPTPSQIATHNRKEPSGNRNSPAHDAGESDDGSLPLDLPRQPSRPAKPKDELPDGFAEFWTEYPRKIDKKDAAAAWRRHVLKTGEDPARVTAALHRHIAMWRAEGREQRFLPHPTTWLNKRRFNDELPDVPHLQSVPAAPEASARTRVRDLPSEPEQAFAQLHERADVDAACELLGRSYVEVEPQRPSDTTPRAEYKHRDRQLWLDQNRDQLLAALRQRSAA